MQVRLTAVQLTDIDNDTIDSVNGYALPQGIKARDMVAAYPYNFFIDKDSFGTEVLCIARIDGQPFSVVASGTVGSYTPDLRNYDILLPINFGQHPIRRPDRLI